MKTWWSNLHPVDRDYISIMGPILGAAALGLLLLLLCVPTAQAQTTSETLIINGNRYIVYSNPLSTTIESWPMLPMQQQNYDHARKYQAPVGTYFPSTRAEGERELNNMAPVPRAPLEPKGYALFYSVAGGTPVPSGWMADKATCERFRNEWQSRRRYYYCLVR